MLNIYFDFDTRRVLHLLLWFLPPASAWEMFVTQFHPELHFKEWLAAFWGALVGLILYQALLSILAKLAKEPVPEQTLLASATQQLVGYLAGVYLSDDLGPVLHLTPSGANFLLAVTGYLLLMGLVNTFNFWSSKPGEAVDAGMARAKNLFELYKAWKAK